MALGTIFTLLVIPALYILIAKEHGTDDPSASVDTRLSDV